MPKQQVTPMMVNIGYTETTFDPDPVTGAPQLVVRFYYDATATPVGPTQPLIDGPRGYCLDLTNNTGAAVDMSVSNQNGQTVSGTISPGDPVTSGQVKSMTAKQLARLGFSTRGDVSSLTLSPA